MEKKKVSLRAKLWTSLVTGIIALVVAYCIAWENPTGNTIGQINEVETAIKDLCKDIGKKGQDIFDELDAEKTGNKSQIPPGFEPVEDQPPMPKSAIPLSQDNTKPVKSRRLEEIESDIAAVKLELEQELNLRTWNEAIKIVSPLVYENQKIAKAKILTYYIEKPSGLSFWDESLWENRFSESNKEWKIQSISGRVFRVTAISVLSCIGVFLLFFILLTTLPWLWFFLLERISELSQAIQGK